MGRTRRKGHREPLEGGPHAEGPMTCFPVRELPKSRRQRVAELAIGAGVVGLIFLWLTPILVAGVLHGCGAPVCLA